MSDTPRTEAAKVIRYGPSGVVGSQAQDMVHASFSRQLERELNEAIAHISTLEDEIAQIREANLELTKTLNNTARK